MNEKQKRKTKYKTRNDKDKTHDYPIDRKLRTDIGKNHNYSQRKITSATWYARKRRSERKAYLELIHYCDQNILDIFNHEKYSHLDEKSKEILACDMLNAKEQAIQYFQEKHEEIYKKYINQVYKIIGKK